MIMARKKIEYKKRNNTVELRVLKLLRVNPEYMFSIKEILEYLEEGNERYIRRVVQKLADDGVIYKRYGPTNSLLYTSNHQLKNIEAHRVQQIGKPELEIPRIEVHPQNVRSLLKNWSEEKWNPKIFHSAQYLPLSIARLFELTSEIYFGSPVSKGDLKEVKENLETFKADLIATCTTVVSLIETEELWDPDRFFEFLMANDAPPVELLHDYIHKLKGKYK